MSEDIDTTDAVLDFCGVLRERGVLGVSETGNGVYGCSCGTKKGSFGAEVNALRYSAKRSARSSWSSMIGVYRGKTGGVI